MNNYEFCDDWIKNTIGNNHHPRVLDYGCGKGEIVELLRKQGIEAFGCDVFYAAAEIRPPANSDIIVALENGIIPFPDQYFDLIVTNQVIEHVEDLDGALTEICRVLKTHGQLLSIFPDLGVWREGHAGIPFLHWFPKGSTLRIYYTLCLRLLGFGLFTKGKTPLEWSKDICIWLDKWTYYRTEKQLNIHYKRYFQEVSSIETIWFDQRLKHRSKIIRRMPNWLKNMIARKFAGMVTIAQK